MQQLNLTKGCLNEELSILSREPRLMTRLGIAPFLFIEISSDPTSHAVADNISCKDCVNVKLRSSTAAGQLLKIDVRTPKSHYYQSCFQAASGGLAKCLMPMKPFLQSSSQ